VQLDGVVGVGAEVVGGAREALVVGRLEVGDLVPVRVGESAFEALDLGRVADQADERIVAQRFAEEPFEAAVAAVGDPGLEDPSSL